MKIINTSNFLKKEAQSRLPGDPGLPPGVTNYMIDKQFEEPEISDYSKQSGEYEARIDWNKEINELVNAGYDVRGLPQQGIGHIKVYYQYDAEVFNEEININNLKLLDIKTFMGGKYQSLTVSEPSTKEGIFEGLENEIVQQEKLIITEQVKSKSN